MSSPCEFVAGPVHIDGHELFFFVDLHSAGATEEVLAAAYTALYMCEHRQELMFAAYETASTRRTEEQWYACARDHFQLHLAALRGSPDAADAIRQAVLQLYFKQSLPAALRPLLARREVCHAA